MTEFILGLGVGILAMYLLMEELEIKKMEREIEERWDRIIRRLDRKTENK